MHHNTASTDYQQLVLDEIKRGKNLKVGLYPHRFKLGRNKTRYLAEGNVSHGMSWCVDCHESESYIMHNMGGFREDISGKK